MSTENSPPDNPAFAVLQRERLLQAAHEKRYREWVDEQAREEEEMTV